MAGDILGYAHLDDVSRPAGIVLGVAEEPQPPTGQESVVGFPESAEVAVAQAVGGVAVKLQLPRGVPAHIRGEGLSVLGGNILALVVGVVVIKRNSALGAETLIEAHVAPQKSVVVGAEVAAGGEGCV